MRMYTTFLFFSLYLDTTPNIFSAVEQFYS